MKFAILDDYQQAAEQMVDWSELPDQVELQVFTDHLADESKLADRLFRRCNLFFLICYDSQPDRIIATQRARDANLQFDDSVPIILDTLQSHRNAFLFQMNPLGARFDSWITDEGSRTSPEWDERWEVLTHSLYDFAALVYLRNLFLKKDDIG